jgi:DNA-binding IclR family transcriptional regulator
MRGVRVMPAPVTNRVGRVFHALGSDVSLVLLNGIRAGCTTRVRLSTKYGVATSTTYRVLRRLTEEGLIRETWPDGEWGRAELEVTKLGEDLIRRVLHELQSVTR